VYAEEGSPNSLSISLSLSPPPPLPLSLMRTTLNSLFPNLSFYLFFVSFCLATCAKTDDDEEEREHGKTKTRSQKKKKARLMCFVRATLYNKKEAKEKKTTFRTT
jgi:hypothetical protein